MATGIWKPRIPDIPGQELMDGYENLSLNASEYEGKSVMILGETYIHVPKDYRGKFMSFYTGKGERIQFSEILLTVTRRKQNSEEGRVNMN